MTVIDIAISEAQRARLKINGLERGQIGGSNHLPLVIVIESSLAGIGLGDLKSANGEMAIPPHLAHHGEEIKECIQAVQAYYRELERPRPYFID